MPGTSEKPPISPETVVPPVRVAASRYAVVKSLCAVTAVAFAMYCVPVTIPGGKPVTEVPGLKPKFPVMTVPPVFVIVELPTPPNVHNEARLTGWVPPLAPVVGSGEGTTVTAAVGNEHDTPATTATAPSVHA
jgi:hypothetical protein